MTPPATEFVQYSVEQSVATIRFNRPEKLNALLPEMIHTYSDLLTHADQDSEVRAIVVTGEGRGFCSGADLSVLGADPQVVQGFLNGQSHKTVPGKYIHLGTPVITAINGPAAGLGFVIAVSSDVRFVHESATLSTTFARLGLIAEYGIAWLLPRLVGYAAATDLLISGRTITGTEAFNIGLAKNCSQDPLDEAYAYARDIATFCSPSSVAAIKSQIMRGAFSEFNLAADDAFLEMAQAFQRSDFEAALIGKLNKTTPNFEGYPLGK